MMASTLAKSVSRISHPLAVNVDRNPRCLRAEGRMIASGYTYRLPFPSPRWLRSLTGINALSERYPAISTDWNVVTEGVV
jgi:hypothetical protein